MRILFFGDVFGRPGRRAVLNNIDELKKEFNPDVVIANCENLASGRGITEKTIKALNTGGVDYFTSGNHLWDRKESYHFLETEKRICKPMNFPEESLGFSYIKHDIDEHTPMYIITLTGQAFMSGCDSPFHTLDEFIDETGEALYFIDFHAESTAEKKALALYFDGRVSAVVGTHTHVQTADEMILPGGTAFITDVGMTGPHDSVIGVRKDIILEKMLTGMPKRHEVAEEDITINAVVLDIDIDNFKAVSISRIFRKVS